MSRYWCIPSSSSSDCNINSCCAVVDEQMQRTFQLNKIKNAETFASSLRNESWRIENILNGRPPVESDWWVSSSLSDLPSSASLGTSLTESDERSEIILDHHITEFHTNDITIDHESAIAKSSGPLRNMGSQDEEDNNENSKNKIIKNFRNVGRECFEKVQSEWRKGNRARHQIVEPTTSTSLPIPYDQLVQIFIANVNANRYSALPQPLSLVDAVEILSAAWESDATSTDD